LEDDHHLPFRVKVQKLHEYSDLFPPPADYKTRIDRFIKDITFKQESASSALLVNCIRVFNELVQLPSRIIAVISKHVKEMAMGMASFQEKGSEEGIVFLENKTELERYCYFVAGTVGLMLTSIFSEGSRRISPPIQESLQRRSVAFGIGLQVTNIAKDFFGDRARGWCYIPRAFFTEEGINPLRDSFADKAEAFLNVQRRIIKLASSYLDEALRYTLDIPRTLIRYRLFCLWPLFMALETLAKLYGERSVFSGQVLKISRQDVKRIVISTSFAVMSNKALTRMYHQTKRKIR